MERARLRVRVAGGSPVRIAVCCGTRDCSTPLATLSGSPYGLHDPHPHEVEWLALRPATDGVMRLPYAIERRWAGAKLRGIPWAQFARDGGLDDRRAYGSKYRPSAPRPAAGGAGLLRYLKPRDRALRRRFGLLPPRLGRNKTTPCPQSFSCPVCRRESRLDVPAWWWYLEPCPHCQPAAPLADGDHWFEPAG